MSAELPSDLDLEASWRQGKGLPPMTAEEIARHKANGGVSDWRSLLEHRNGRVIPDERNIGLALTFAPELRGMVRFNEFSLRVEFNTGTPWRNVRLGDVWTDDDDHGLQVWLQERGIDTRNANTIASSVQFTAKEHAVHPVRDYLAALSWDTQPRLSTWLERCLDANGPSDYLSAVGTRFLLSAVARIRSPGCQADHVLVLEGPQGIGKSETARILATNPDWFADDMPDIHTKDAAIQLCGKWIIELAELAAVRRAEIEGVKAFLSREVDVFRPPYGRRSVSVPRQCVFIATTNEALYLRDPTGNRRFWPVKCGCIDLDALRAERDQLWAEAVELYQAGIQWHPTQEESALAADEQSERVMVTELEADVAEYLDRMATNGVMELDTRRVMVDALHLDASAADFSERAVRLGPQVAAAMARAGWHKVKRTGRPGNRRTTYRKSA
jgi:predicted P-loop ATPase